MTKPLSAAQALYDLGFSVFPLLPRDKRPFIPWKEFSIRRATPERVALLFESDYSEFNIGIATGVVSGVVVVDVDSPEAAGWAEENLPPTPMRVRTARGEHWYYRHPGHRVRNKARLKTGDAHIALDIRGDGGYVLGPGSIHPSGARYEWVGELSPVVYLPVFESSWVEAEPVPEAIPGAAPRRHVPSGEKQFRASRYIAAIPPAVEGEGGDLHTFQVACRVSRGFDLNEDETYELLREWNAKCVPPWAEGELREKIANAREYGDEPIGGRLGARLPAELPDDFVTNDKGKIVPTHNGNIRLALRKLSIDLSFDEFGRRPMLGAEPLNDSHVVRARVDIGDRFGFRVPKDDLSDMMADEANRNAFHPVRDYLDSLTWDGIPRVDEWLVRYGGAENTAYVRAVSAIVLIAAVRRVRVPGCKFDELLVLESSQGSLKSSALAALCPNESWFGDDLPLGVDAKQVIERTTSRWLIEAAEMHGHRGRETDQMKAFLSRQVDGPVRLAYARFSTAVPRQFILIATTNSRNDYLKDPTGSRRFWPVRVGQFDVDALARDRDQIWAEAASREAWGESTRLAQELWPAAGEEQEQRRAVDPWEDILGRLADDYDGFVASAKIWSELGVETGQQDRRHSDRIAGIMQQLGYKRGRRTEGGKQVRGWAKEHWVSGEVEFGLDAV